MRTLFFLLVFFAFGASAQTGRITKIKGTKAIVEFQDSVLPKVGDPVSVTTGAPINPKRPLRTRENGVALRYVNTSTKMKAASTGGSASTTSKSHEAEISYSRNFGRFEVGGYLDREFSSEDGTDSDELDLGGALQYNFISNTRENKYVPYIRGSLALVTGKISDATTSFKISGSATGVQIGVMVFPFSELVALDLAYTYQVGKFESDTEPKIKFDGTIQGLLAGWRIYF